MLHSPILDVVFEFKNRQIIVISLNNKIIYQQHVFNSQGTRLGNRPINISEELIIRECFLQAWMILYRSGLVNYNCSWRVFDSLCLNFLKGGKFISAS